MREVPENVASSETEEIVWRDAGVAYEPVTRPLSEFLSSIELVSPAEPELGSSKSSLLIFIDERCLRQMHAHVTADVQNEQAGILGGLAYLDPDVGAYAVVDGVFPASASASPAHFRFREDSWNEIWNTMPSSSALLGWYHSHPGLGIFMSATDRKTQALHFGAVWQIAIVLDPIAGRLGIFHGAEATPVAEASIFLYRDEGRS